MFLSEWTLAALRFAGILGPSQEMVEEQAEQRGHKLKKVRSNRKPLRDNENKDFSKLAKPTRETLLKQFRRMKHTLKDTTRSSLG